jgi:hypothetical protein
MVSVSTASRSMCRTSPGAQVHYDRRKTNGDCHTADNTTRSSEFWAVYIAAYSPDSTTTNRFAFPTTDNNSITEAA